MYVVTITPEDGSLECKIDVVPVKGGLSDWQRLVGGLIEVVPTFHGDLELLINEEGKLDHLPLNLVATAISPLREYDFLVGSAVLVRLNKRRDNWTGWQSREDAFAAYCELLVMSDLTE